MKVLIIHQHFNTPHPGGPIRTYYLATALLSAGFEVVVLAGHNEPAVKTVFYEGIEIRYLPVRYEGRFGFYRRIASFAQFAIRAWRAATTIDFQLCYAVSVPLTVGLSAVALERLAKRPFFFEVGDLWPDAPVELGFVRNPLLKRFLKSAESLIYSRAQKVIALSPMIRDELCKRTDPRKVILVPNMADTRFFQPQENTGAAILTVAYIGAVGFANGLDFYLECARASLRAGLPLKFVLCGDGPFLARLKSFAGENVEFVPFQNRDGVRQVLARSHAAFVCYRPFRILETGSPNKYFDGLAAGKLIIVNFGGWIRDEIEQRRCGFAVDPRNPADFVEKITPFLTTPALLAEYQKNARDLAERKYSREQLGAALAGHVRAFLAAT